MSDSLLVAPALAPGEIVRLAAHSAEAAHASLIATTADDAAEADAAFRRAFDPLFDQLMPRVWDYLSKKVPACRDADDVVADLTQQTMIKIGNAIERCEASSDGAVVRWALTTAHHVMLDAFRSPETGLAARAMAVGLDELRQDTVSFEVADGGREPGSRAYEILVALTMEAYNAAAESVGALFWWRLIGGREWVEVGAALDTTGPAAKRRFQRAVETLRAEVERRVEALPSPDREDVRRLVARFDGAAEARCVAPQEADALNAWDAAVA